MGSPAPLIFEITSRLRTIGELIWRLWKRLKPEFQSMRELWLSGYCFCPCIAWMEVKRNPAGRSSLITWSQHWVCYRQIRLAQEQNKQVQQTPEYPRDESLSRLNEANSAENWKFHSQQDCRTNSVEPCVNLNAFSVKRKRARLQKSRPNWRSITPWYYRCARGDW